MPLVALGRLTGLDGLGWSMPNAPLLAYNGAGRLFIVYDGRVVRPSSDAEQRAYRRTHGAAQGGGKVSDGGVAVGPFRSLGPSRVIRYTTKKHRDRELVDYVHTWGEGRLGAWTAPVVQEHRCVAACGARCAAAGTLRLWGGSYTVSERGIVG